MVTPVRRQYLDIKNAYPDALVLFRLGDFYEAFDDDAQVASRELEITLTSRSMGKNLKIPMAGVPAHALDSYLVRLVKKGYKVAICEQLSDPATSKGLLERDVVRVVTPGTVLETALLDQNANNYLVAVVQEGPQVGLAYVDASTGEFAVTQTTPEKVHLELSRLDPAEILVPDPEQSPAETGLSLLPGREPESPLDIKNAYSDALVLFRLGDFYEAFDDDAQVASRELEITLTSRSMGKNLKIPMAGVPAHALDSYLVRLVKKGYKVAICEQLSDPATSKGLLERDVVRVVTPGTVLETALLDQNANNYLVAVVQEGLGFD